MVSRPGFVKGYVYRDNVKVAHIDTDGNLDLKGEIDVLQTIT